MPTLSPKKLCTGYLACYESCKHNAIKLYVQDGLNHITIESDKCINCKLCEQSCPIVNPIKPNKISNAIIYGGWCKNETLRMSAASGGAFTAIALAFFKLFKKAIIVGATLENNVVKHIIIEEKSELLRLTNSKYIQSDIIGIYPQVKEKLRNGYYVLFSGTPCQIAGLYGFLGKYKESNFLYTTEIICHGAPGKEAINLHLKYYNSKQIYSFRDKSNGWKDSYRTTIIIHNIPTKINKAEDKFYQIYTSCLLDRRSCSNCLYSAIDRVSDITLGDFWGKDFTVENNKKGVSLIIANNSHGNSLLQSSSDDLYLFNSNLIEAINGQPRLYDGFKYIQFHPVALFPKFFKKFLPEHLRLSILTNRMPWKLLWGIYRFASILHTKRIKKRIIKKFCV